MNNKSLIFKIASITLLAIDIAFLLFFITEAVLVVAKINFLSNLHIVLFVVFIIANLIYISYISTLLIFNKLKSKNK